jgi:hypothetical protein
LIDFFKFSALDQNAMMCILIDMKYEIEIKSSLVDAVTLSEPSSAKNCV